jgi:hypothetical protein
MKKIKMIDIEKAAGLFDDALLDFLHRYLVWAEGKAVEAHELFPSDWERAGKPPIDAWVRAGRPVPSHDAEQEVRAFIVDLLYKTVLEDETYEGWEEIANRMAKRIAVEGLAVERGAYRDCLHHGARLQ